jgi:hypothetical protein
LGEREEGAEEVEDLGLGEAGRVATAGAAPAVR